MHCHIPQIENATEHPNYVATNKNLVYTCKTGFANPSTTRKCTSGELFPSIKNVPLACRPVCRVPKIDNASYGTSQVLSSGGFVEYTCNKGYSPLPSRLQFECIDGVIDIADAKCQR